MGSYAIKDVYIKVRMNLYPDSLVGSNLICELEKLP